MGRSLNEFSAATRRRIQEQIYRDAEAARARRDGAARGAVSGDEPQQGARPPLRKNSRAKKRGTPSTGRRYRVDFIAYRRRPFDWDNTVASLKQLQDLLVEAGWLPDGDGWRELEGSAKSVKCDTESEERVEVFITRIH